ncbi:hypothetical protein [Halpernia frigidisoli]|uniref:Carboxypeptidase-like regulatory domain-containing protein n=1 Tax=Halpernia frigidisoli TaxID=1125876 RepID=A0A1I3HW59_9FLAO|nr:hypothetical protein [Halpernia frigidisoli]SFI39986.1 hypothetical protein SAMN05443292_2425 [Halpernia frigidisoli]
MRSSFKIDKPCSKSWESMNEDFGGKFCQFCEKKVWDLTEKDDLEISEILKTNKNICGRISNSKINFAASLAFSASLSLVSCASSTNFKNNKNSEISINQNVIFKGNLKAGNGAIIKNTSVEFVTLGKLFSTTSDQLGDFSMEIPLTKIEKKNILIFSSKNLSTSKRFRDTISQHLIIQKTDLFLNKTLTLRESTTQIGAVVIVSPTPPDFYYFDGKEISEKKFKTILKANPNYRELVFDEDDFTKILTNTNFVGHVYLLYSQ